MIVWFKVSSQVRDKRIKKGEFACTFWNYGCISPNFTQKKKTQNMKNVSNFLQKQTLF